MIKPPKLNKGDKIAAITLSWGGPGTFPHRFEAGKRQLEEAFELEVVPTKHALKPADWIYRNPQARAEDLMTAFEDSSIKAIITTIGGEDSVRTLPYIDFNIIHNHPKIFLGFSDTTVTHFCCLKAGLVSFYGPALMTGFAENGGILPYFEDSVNRTLFSNKIIGQLHPNISGWTNELLDWSDPSNQFKKRKMEESTGWRFIQGNTKVQGRLIGGCMDVLEFIKGTSVWPELKFWENTILFLETSEEMPSQKSVKYWLRNYAAQGILPKIAGLIVGRSYKDYVNNRMENYDEVISQVVKEEYGLVNLPVITNIDFGHTDPSFIIPYGVMAEIDCTRQKFSIIEPACI
jgi:muramoyltetrapeptide carboxypeptidase LdcA involved in peptidoglycan recycling